MTDKPKFAFTFAAAEAATKSNAKPAPAYSAEERAVIDKLTEMDTQVRALQDAARAERAKLEAKLRADMAPLMEQRSQMISGAVSAAKAPASSAFGTFWLTAMRCHPLLALRIEAQDVDILKHLVDVRCPHVEETDKGEKKSGFAVTLVFSENKYFSNKELTKKFFYTPAPPGAILERTEGTVIDWKSEEVNATVEIVKRAVPGRGGGRGRNNRGGRRGGRGRKNKGGKQAVQYEVVAEPQPSFFRFFEDLDEEEEELDSEEQEMLEGLEADYFDMACLLRNKVYTHAIGWFTGANITELPMELQQMALMGPDAFGDKPSFGDVIGYGMPDGDDDDGDDDDDDNLEEIKAVSSANKDADDTNDPNARGKPVGKDEKKPEECAKQQQ